MSIVDAHVHILPESARTSTPDIDAEPWFAECHPPGCTLASAETLIHAMDRHGVDRAVCFSWPFRDPERCREGNDYVASAMQRFPRRLVGGAVVQPRSPDAEGELERCARVGFRGVGELNSDAQGWDWGGQEISSVVETATRLGMPVTLHCSEPVGHRYRGKGSATPDRIETLVERHPQARLILAHLGGGLPFYGHMPEIADLFQQVWVDTAAVPFLYRPTAYRSAVDLCGVDRVLFGSDHPLLDLPRYRADLIAAGLHGEELADILGNNAERLFGL